MTYLQSGHRVVPLLGDEAQTLIDDFEGAKFGALRLDPDGWFFTSPFLLFAEKYYSFKFRSSDIIINTFAKCGTTWTQEIIWTLVHNPDLNHPRANVSIMVRCPNYEADLYFRNTTKTLFDPGQALHDNFVREFPHRDPKDGVFLQHAELAQDPRVIKTHLPLCLVTPNALDTCKVIYVARNPRDVVASFFDFGRKFRLFGFRKDMDCLIDHFINGTVQTGPYWAHLREAWKRRHHPNFLFCYFEDMKADPRGMIVRFKEFLGLHRTDQQIDNVVEYTSFSAMKERDNFIDGGNSEIAVNKDIVKAEGGFFNKGKSGSWKEKLTAKEVEKLDAWIKENVQDFGDDFRYKNLDNY